MRSELEIEEARKSDHAAIVVLLQDTNLPPDGIEPHLENFLIIRHPEAVTGPEFLVGSVGLEIYGESALLRSLAVHPDFQGAGLGSRLVDGIIEVAKRKGITRLFLLTDTAEEYFKKRGFLIVARDQVPDDMKQSVEFTTLCTSSPSMMREIQDIAGSECNMSKVEVKGRVSPYPMPVAILGVMLDDRPNFMTIAWFNRFNGNPSIWGVGIGKGKITLEAIEKHGQFSINFPSSGQVVETDYCGIMSGRDVDKGRLFKVFKGNLENAPMIEECPLSLECTLYKLVDLPKTTLVLGEVITAYSDDRFITNGVLDPKKIDPIILTQPDNHYWTIGDIIDDAFEVGKKLK